ncbi:MAG: hypothetical protein GWM87_14870 [Xanthomonadales bacterium]|nr:hypothetical protein [Xanthomonadales bacterium]NIX14077.1 hypothetical protein [Xanthomonadales bacterium]
MSMSKYLLVLIAAAAILAGCTASVRVMPGQHGANRVVARDIEKHGAEKAAFKAAVEYCEDRGMEAVFVSDKVRYEGSMDEDERNEIRRQSEAATVVGGILKTAHHEDAGLILESAGAAGSAATSGRDYTAEVEFACRIS